MSEAFSAGSHETRVKCQFGLKLRSVRLVARRVQGANVSSEVQNEVGIGKIVLTK